MAAPQTSWNDSEEGSPASGSSLIFKSSKKVVEILPRWCQYSSVWERRLLLRSSVCVDEGSRCVRSGCFCGLSVVSGCVAAAAEEPSVTVCAYLCVRVRKRERCVRLCCWLMSGEGSGRSRDHKGNPGRTVKSSIRVWSCESVAVCKCVWAWGLRGVEEQDWHQQARDETARYWHSLVRLREVDFS